MRRGCYPGSFNPLTRAHLAIADAARTACGLDRVDLVLSRVALAKEHVEDPPFDDRVAAVREVVEARAPALGLVVSDRQLLVDLAAGYDVLVMGADKWAQVLDPVFYGGSTAARDAAVAALPPLAVATRPGVDIDLPPHATVLRLPPELAEVSSTGVRAGRTDWLARPGRSGDGREAVGGNDVPRTSGPRTEG